MSFRTTDYLLFKQDKKELDNELVENFNPYLTIKSFSFYENGKMVDYINETLNTYGHLFKTKEDQFRFFQNIIPKQKFKKITYIKKPKQEKFDQLPIPEFYSKREIDIMEDMYKYDHE